MSLTLFVSSVKVIEIIILIITMVARNYLTLILLDLSVDHLSHDDLLHTTYDIYHKDSYTSISVKGNCIHSHTYKTSVTHAIIYQLLSILPLHFNPELDLIQSIANRYFIYLKARWVDASREPIFHRLIFYSICSWKFLLQVLQAI